MPLWRRRSSFRNRPGGWWTNWSSAVPWPRTTRSGFSPRGHAGPRGARRGGGGGRVVTRQPAKARGRESPEEKRRRVLEVIRILVRTYPGVTLALNFTPPLELLIALILAAQCTAKRVNQVTAS